MWLELEDVVQRQKVRQIPPANVDTSRSVAISQHRAQTSGPIGAELASSIGDGAMTWHVLCVQPGHESIAAAHLVGRRFGIYLPTRDREVRVRGKKHLRQAPMFPGYIFLSSIGLNGNWRRVRACPGVTSVVCIAGTDRPATVPFEFIDRVQFLELKENGTLNRCRRGNRGWRKRADDKVKFTIRAYSGFQDADWLTAQGRDALLSKALGLAS